MRAPLSWLREYVDLPASETGRDVAARLIAAGLEVETVERTGAGLKGPLVVGRVLAVEELSGFKKPIRYCQVDVGGANGTGEPQNLICGATNFAVGDNVVVVLPGAVLPGGFEISARKTYGHVSEGMICSERELGLGEDHGGILVLPPEHEAGTDAIELLELVDEVLDIAVTPDRGYCLSLRGLARETATAYGLPLRDPALLDVPPPTADGYPVRVADPLGCDRFTARTVSGLRPGARSPIWLQRRLQKAGMRPVSLPVDITNYVMLELGQPLHAYDRSRVQGTIGVRRAESGEKLITLDGVKRTLDAGRPGHHRRPRAHRPGRRDGGGADTEIADAAAGPDGGTAGTTDVVIEAAHFDPVSVARSARRHKLSSEASRRFERGVDPQAAAAAAQRTVDLLKLLAGGTADPGVTEITTPSGPRTVRMAADHPDRVAGVAYGRETVVRRLQQVGCDVYGNTAPSGTPGAPDELTVTVPSWRPDLTDPNDLAEEVARLEGYENLPATLPRPLPGRGLTERQRLHRRVGRALAGAGYVEAPSYPFVGAAAFDALGLEAGDPRRHTVQLVNPLSDEEPGLRTTLLPGLLASLRRNDGRGSHDLALFETGLVFLPTGNGAVAGRPPVTRRPTREELDALDAALPEQPRHVAAVLAGSRERAGWWGAGRSATWADAVEAARTVAAEAGVRLTVESAAYAPWHPGRCAALHVLLDGAQVLAGHAGELHPRVLKALGLPERTCAMELDLDLVERAGGGPVRAPHVSTFPVATQDVALVVDAAVPAAAVESALRAGAGELLESLRLFDVFTGEQLGAGRKSLAYALRFRAPDRTLKAEEASAARDAAVAEAVERTGAVLRGA